MSTAVKLKVCGMRDAHNIRDVLTARPDYMGFIFYEKSPRFVGDQLNIPGEVATESRVGVFVNASLSDVLQCITHHQLGNVQLHGEETPGMCEQIRQRGVRVIKSFHLSDAADLHQTHVYESVVDYFLFDTPGKFYGGNAQSFDWSLLDQYHQRVPVFLAGGIGTHNIKLLLDQNRWNLHAIDVNSSAEISPAMKNERVVLSIRQSIDEYNNQAK